MPLEPKQLKGLAMQERRSIVSDQACIVISGDELTGDQSYVSTPL